MRRNENSPTKGDVKKFKVTVKVELELPADFEVVTDPTDSGLRCLKRGPYYYTPELAWLMGKYDLGNHLFGKYETEPTVVWKPTNEDQAEEFVAAVVEDNLAMRELTGNPEA